MQSMGGWKGTRPWCAEEAMLKSIKRALVETGFIIFLFYANLLMGEFTHSSAARHHDLWWALADEFTGTNALIAIVAAVIGYFIFEYLRKSVRD